VGLGGLGWKPRDGILRDSISMRARMLKKDVNLTLLLACFGLDSDSIYGPGKNDSVLLTETHGEKISQTSTGKTARIIPHRLSDTVIIVLKAPTGRSRRNLLFFWHLLILP